MSQLDTHNPLDDKRPRDTLGAALSLPPLERAGKIPFVFHNCYDISLDGVRSLHPFDFKKRSGVYAELERELRLSRSSIYTPERANDALLGLVHEPSYIRALSNPALAAKVMGIPDLAFLPADTIEHGLLDPLRYAVGGTVLVVLLNINAADTLHTALLAGLGAVVSFSVSLFLKWLLKLLRQKWKN